MKCSEFVHPHFRGAAKIIESSGVHFQVSFQILLLFFGRFWVGFLLDLFFLSYLLCIPSAGGV